MEVYVDLSSLSLLLSSDSVEGRPYRPSSLFGRTLSKRLKILLCFSGCALWFDCLIEVDSAEGCFCSWLWDGRSTLTFRGGARDAGQESKVCNEKTRPDSRCNHPPCFLIFTF